MFISNVSIACSISNVENGNKTVSEETGNTRTRKQKQKRSGRCPCHWGQLWGLTLSGDVQVANQSKFIDLESFHRAKSRLADLRNMAYRAWGSQSGTGGLPDTSQPKVENEKNSNGL